jgi:hypothetical protein
MLDDVLPAEQRQTALKAAMGVLALLVLLRLLSNWWIDRVAYRVADILETRER